MITKEVFLNHIQQTIIPELNNQEKKRRRVLFQSIVIGLVGTIIAAFLAWYGLTQNNGYTLLRYNVLFKTAVVVFAISISISALHILLFLNKVKKATNEKVLNFLGFTGTIPQEHFPLKRLCSLNFFKHYDSKIIDDSFRSLNQPYYAVHELTLIKGRKASDTFFQGQVLYYTVPKPYATPIMILKRQAMLTPTIGKSNEVEWQEVTLEDTEFNQEYRIFAKDQVGVRIVLKPRFMEKLKDIKDTYNASFRILFIDNYFIIALNTRKNMFEFYRIAQKPSLKQFAQFYDEIKVLTDLVETLNFK